MRKAIHRSVDNVQMLQALDPRISCAVVTDEGSNLGDMAGQVHVVTVPESFAPPKAKHKARALEYFRLHSKLGSEDWVLHLDEETIINDHCIKACLAFIEKTNYDYGQVWYNL